MIINLSPQLVDEVPGMEVSVSGSILIINGEPFDFGVLAAGHFLPAAAIGSDWFVGPVVRHDNGELEVTLLFMHPSNASENMRFPVPIHVENGQVEFPPNTTPEPEEVITPVTEDLESQEEPRND